jgi:ATP-dependent helicase YprA (DUF1998 family)
MAARCHGGYLDSVVIAGTGAGKTMPFMMPLLLDTNKEVIIVSPLKVLQADQVRMLSSILFSENLISGQAVRFDKMQIPTTAVNGDTWCSKLHKVCHIDV